MDAALIGFALPHYLTVLLLGIFAYVFGRRILIKFKFNNAWEDIAFSVGLGLGVIIFLVMILGFIHLLYKWLVIAVLIAGFLACYPVYIKWPKRIADRVKKDKSFYWKLLAGVAIAVAAVLVLLPILQIPLFPPVRYDSTSYHLPMAKYFTQWHAIHLTPYLRYPVFTLNMHMLFTLMLLVHDDIAVHLSHFLCLVITTVALIGWGTRVQSTRAGIWAGIVLISTPQLFKLASDASIDIGLTLFTTLGIYAFMNWLYTREDKWAWVSAAFMGLAVGTKYSSLLLVFLFAFIILFFDFRARNFRNIIIFSLVTLVVACPWLIRNMIYTGNPVFPFFANIFGIGIWTEDDLTRQMAEMTSHGTGRSFESLFKMPWNLIYHREHFLENHPLSKIWLFALPLAVICGNFKSYTRWLLAICLVFFLYWFSSVQVMRYLDPILPAFALLIGISFDMVLKWIPIWNKFEKKLAVNVIVTVLVIAALVVPGVKFAREYLRPRVPIPITNEQRLEFLSRRWGKPFRHMPLIVHLNEIHGQDYRIYSFNDRQMVYYTDGVLIGDWFGPGNYREIISADNKEKSFKDSETVFHILRDELDVDYLLMNKARLNIEAPTDDFFRQHFRIVAVIPSQHLVFADTVVTLYEIID